MPFSWFTDSVTVARPGTKTERGATVPDWANATTRTVSGCSVQTPLASTSMSLDGRTQTTRGGTIYAPAGADIEAGDRVEWGGRTFTVTGEPCPWVSPTGRVSHLEAPIDYWRG